MFQVTHESVKSESDSVSRSLNRRLQSVHNTYAIGSRRDEHLTCVVDKFRPTARARGITAACKTSYTARPSYHGFPPKAQNKSSLFPRNSRESLFCGSSENLDSYMGLRNVCSSTRVRSLSVCVIIKQKISIAVRS